MKSFFVIALLMFSGLFFVQPTAIAEKNEIQGGGCRYVCKEELKICRKGKKACKAQYLRCVRDCPRSVSYTHLTLPTKRIV